MILFLIIWLLFLLLFLLLLNQFTSFGLKVVLPCAIIHKFAYLSVLHLIFSFGLSVYLRFYS